MAGSLDDRRQHAGKAAPQALLFPRRALRSSADISAFVLFSGGLVWLVILSADALNYNWQWYRVPQFFVREIDGEWYAAELLHGLYLTLELVALSLPLTVAFGFTTALLARADSITARLFNRVYVEVIRNTPLLVQIYIFYFVLSPILGTDRFTTAIVALAVYEGAYAAEIFRSGIDAVPMGQWDAARSLGLSTFHIYRSVVVPQLIRFVLPPMTNLAVSLIKGSAIVSVIAVAELTTNAKTVIAETFMTFEIWFFTAAIYLVLTTSLSGVAYYLEARLRRRGA